MEVVEELGEVGVHDLLPLLGHEGREGFAVVGRLALLPANIQHRWAWAAPPTPRTNEHKLDASGRWAKVDTASLCLLSRTAVWALSAPATGATRAASKMPGRERGCRVSAEPHAACPTSHLRPQQALGRKDPAVRHSLVECHRQLRLQPSLWPHR
eukprot:4851102-Prymnesium_polylepis.1